MDLPLIQIEDQTNPASLLHQWINESRPKVGLILINLATANKTGRVRNRTVIVQDIESDGSIAFYCQVKSNKVKDMNENPQVAGTILLMYQDSNQLLIKQIRVEGNVVKLPHDQCKIYFERESVAGKIRAWACQNCEAVNWTEHKRTRDELLKEVVEKKKVLETPETICAYKIIPSYMEFYSAIGEEVEDRVSFKLGENGQWNFEHLMC